MCRERGDSYAVAGVVEGAVVVRVCARASECVGLGVGVGACVGARYGCAGESGIWVDESPLCRDGAFVLLLRWCGGVVAIHYGGVALCCGVVLSRVEWYVVLWYVVLRLLWYLLPFY